METLSPNPQFDHELCSYEGTPSSYVHLGIKLGILILTTTIAGKFEDRARKFSDDHEKAIQQARAEGKSPQEVEEIGRRLRGEAHSALSEALEEDENT